MKLTYNEGRTDKKGNAYEANHNSRELTSGAWNIKHELTPFNTYLCFDEEGHAIERRDFESFELEYYRKHFSEGIDAINDKYEKSGHKSNVQTLEERYKSEKFCPKECIIQVAKWNELRQEHEYSLDPDLLLKSVLEWVKEIQKEFPQFKILDLALHVDETSPHIHVRGVFIGHDKGGHELPSQAKALKEMKVEKTCISAEKSKSRRYNNEAVTFETKSRGLMEDIVEKTAGITLDKERGEGGLDRGEYIRKREKELIEGAKREAKKEAEQILDDADRKAGKIIADADVMAIKIKKVAREQGFKEGEEAFKKSPEAKAEAIKEMAMIDYKAKRVRIETKITILEMFRDNRFEEASGLCHDSRLGEVYEAHEQYCGLVHKLTLDGQTFLDGDTKKIQSEIIALQRGFRQIEEDYKKKEMGYSR